MILYNKRGDTVKDLLVDIGSTFVKYAVFDSDIDKYILSEKPLRAVLQCSVTEASLICYQMNVKR